MNLSQEAIDALIRAGRYELDSLDKCVADEDRIAERNSKPADPIVDQWRKEAAALRSALDEATAYRDHLRRISR